MGESGLPIFEQYCKDKQWNTVFAFVAGLTYYKHRINNPAFIRVEKGVSKLTSFLILCLFESQNMNSLIGRDVTYVGYSMFRTPLDCHALGYCIANSPVGVTWNIDLRGKDLAAVKSGLMTKVPSTGVIKYLCIHSDSPANLTALQSYPLTGITSIDIRGHLKNAGLFQLSELILQMPSLEELNFCCTGHIVRKGLLKILQQLSRSTVTILDITNTGFCSLLESQDIVSALQRLIHPRMGRLKELRISTIYRYNSSTLASLVCSDSSLQTLHIVIHDNDPFVLRLHENKNLTKLHLEGALNVHIPELKEIIKLERLEHLVLRQLYITVENCKSLEEVVMALKDNKTLKVIEIGTVSLHPQTHDELAIFKRIWSLDPRLKHCD